LLEETGRAGEDRHGFFFCRKSEARIPKSEKHPKPEFDHSATPKRFLQ